jgi:hypothetical protein
MHPFLNSRLAVFVAIVSLAIWSAFALLVAVRPNQKKMTPVAAVAPAIDESVPVVSLAVADALPVSTSKGDRLPWPSLAKPEPAMKPAEPIDYAQADAETEIMYVAPMPRLLIFANATTCTRSGPKTAGAGGAGDDGAVRASRGNGRPHSLQANRP